MGTYTSTFFIKCCGIKQANDAEDPSLALQKQQLLLHSLLRMTLAPRLSPESATRVILNSFLFPAFKSSQHPDSAHVKVTQRDPGECGKEGINEVLRGKPGNQLVMEGTEEQRLEDKPPACNGNNLP